MGTSQRDSLVSRSFKELELKKYVFCGISVSASFRFSYSTLLNRKTSIIQIISLVSQRLLFFIKQHGFQGFSRTVNTWCGNGFESEILHYRKCHESLASRKLTRVAWRNKRSLLIASRAVSFQFPCLQVYNFSHTSRYSLLVVKLSGNVGNHKL